MENKQNKEASNPSTKPKFRTKEENRRLHDLIKERVKIIEYAQELGFTVQRIGSYYTLKEHESVRIKNNNSFVRYADTDEKGSVIDFALTFTNKSLHEVLADFTERVIDEFEYGEDYTDHGKIEKNYEVNKKEYKEKKLEMPSKDENMRNVYAYLLKSRYIHQDIVQDMVNRKQLYQDQKKNCAFVGYDKHEPTKPIFVSLRGTNTFKRFAGDVPGCDYQQGLMIENNSPHLMICESPIDTLSKMTLLHLQGKDYKAYDYLILSGSEKYQSAINQLQEGKYEKIIFSLDNDEAGLKAIGKIKEAIQDKHLFIEMKEDLPQLGKDWNDELKHVISRGYRMDYEIPSDDQKNLVGACLTTYIKSVLQDKTPRTHKQRLTLIQDKQTERELALQDFNLSKDLDPIIMEIGLQHKNMDSDRMDKQWIQERVKEIFDKFNKKKPNRLRTNDKQKSREVER